VALAKLHSSVRLDALTSVAARILRVSSYDRWYSGQSTAGGQGTADVIGLILIFGVAMLPHREAFVQAQKVIHCKAYHAPLCLRSTESTTNSRGTRHVHGMWGQQWTGDVVQSLHGLRMYERSG